MVIFITLGALFTLMSTTGQMQNTGPKASRPKYLMYRNVSVHAGKYRLGDGLPSLLLGQSHGDSGYVLYDDRPHHLSRMNWTRAVDMQQGEKPSAFTGKRSR